MTRRTIHVGIRGFSLSFYPGARGSLRITNLSHPLFVGRVLGPDEFTPIPHLVFITEIPPCTVTFSFSDGRTDWIDTAYRPTYGEKTVPVVLSLRFLLSFQLGGHKGRRSGLPLVRLRPYLLTQGF